MKTRSLAVALALVGILFAPQRLVAKEEAVTLEVSGMS